MISPKHFTLRSAFFLSLLLGFGLSGCLETPEIRVGDVLESRGPIALGESADQWDLHTEGGNAGKILEVTTLRPIGPGSLEAALNAKGPRKIVFRVGGTIDLGARAWVITEPRLTLDASEAPEPGITLIRGGLIVDTHDVIIRHLRVRPGEAGFAKKSGWEIDGITTGGNARKVLVENCSISWSTDENLSASGPRFDGPDPEAWRKNTSHQILFRNNLIAEGLSRSTHSEEEHSKGSLIHDNVTKVALIGNLYVSNMQRNPLFKGGTRAIFANNVVHNPGEWAVQYILVKKEWEGKTTIPGELVLVGNVVQFGPDTPPEMPIGNFIGPARAYIHDNRVLNPKTANLGIPWVGTYEELREAPFWLKDYNARPSSNTLAWVLDNAGARPWSRDATDRRLVEEVRNRSGSIKNSEKEAEGYPRDGSTKIP